VSLPCRPGRRSSSTRPGRDGDDHGVAAVEFALVLPLVVMLVFAAITAGTIATAQLDVNSTARDAARAGALDSSAACTLATTRLADAGSALGATSCTHIATCPGVDSVIRIDATRTVTIPFIGDRTIDLSSTASYRCEI